MADLEDLILKEANRQGQQPNQDAIRQAGIELAGAAMTDPPAGPWRDLAGRFRPLAPQHHAGRVHARVRRQGDDCRRWTTSRQPDRSDDG